MALATQMLTENGLTYPHSLTPEPNGTPTPTPSTSTAFDPELFRSYLLSLLPPVIGATREELEDTLFDPDFDEKVTRFSADGGGVIYVQKVKADAEGMF